MANIALYFADSLPPDVGKPTDPRADVWVFDPSPSGVFPPGYRVYRSLATLCEHVTHGGTIKESLQLIAVPATIEKYPGEYTNLQEVLRDGFSTREIRFNTVVHRYKSSVDSFIQNLPLAATYPWLLSAGNALKDTPVFVVGAGPSLDKNGPLLRECAKRGVVFGLHSSAGAIRHHGCEIDLLCCIESLDTSGFVRDLDGVRAAALCLTAGRANFNTPFTKYIFSPGGNAFANTSIHLGGQWLHYGANVSSAAACLAVRMGCSTVVLLGQDLSYTGGRVYATGSGREHVTVSVADDTITRSDIADQTARYKAHGLKLEEAPRPKIMVPGWGGGAPVATTQDMLAFLRWLEVFGDQRRDIRLVNATEGGVHIANTEESTLEQVLDTLPEQKSRFGAVLSALTPVRGDRVARVVSELTRGALVLKNRCNMALSASPHQFPRFLAEVKDLVAKNQLVYELAHPSTALLEVSDLLEHKKGKPFVRLIKESCDDLVKRLAA